VPRLWCAGHHTRGDLTLKTPHLEIGTAKIGTVPVVVPPLVVPI
jgi:hypothetical protein